MKQEQPRHRRNSSASRQIPGRNRLDRAEQKFKQTNSRQEQLRQRLNISTITQADEFQVETALKEAEH